VDQLVDIKTDKTAGIDAFLTRFSAETGSSQTGSLPAPSPVETYELNLVRKLVPYDFEKPDLLKRLFEELYLGKKVFSRFYATPSFFNFSESLLENETLIPTEKTLKRFYQKFGEHAIYSERPRDQGLYLLEKHNLAKYFDEEQLIFLEDMFVEKGGNKRVLLNKPNPTFLIELIAKHTGDPVEIAYIGDGVADALLVKNARLKGVSNLWFIGVLSSSRYPNKLVSTYKTLKADAIMNDVNALSSLLDSLGGTS
jgi:phosphoglycolate phosphatase-like HAD superfamily hydrolase